LKDRKEATRRRWLEVLQEHRLDWDRAGSEHYWSPRLDTAPRGELRRIQNTKLAAAVPFLYENSPFYRRRFERLGMTPDDIRTVDDLPKWPVVDKREMIEDALAHPPYGTYSAHDDALWAERGWMIFGTSGTTGTPRVFRYSQFDREQWEWANARALHSMGFRKGDCAMLISGFGPHVWIWGVSIALQRMGIPMIPGGGLDARMRGHFLARYGATILACTPSYALYLGRAMQEMGLDPAKTAVKTIFLGGEPWMGIPATRKRLEDLWGARPVEFYGCTEASPHAGGFSCPHAVLPDGQVATHLMEDIAVWELVDAETKAPVPVGRRGLTVTTNLNSESSPQLRFLVGDYTVLDDAPCACGRTHVRAIGSFVGRADDIVTIRGIKLYPSQIEEGVRAVPGIGDEYEIVLATQADGLDTMTIRVEHPAQPADAPKVAEQVAAEVRTRCEVRVVVEVLRPGTLPRTEFKAKRVRDTRAKA
jgi:phenylacetate-CoA ligase